YPAVFGAVAEGRLNLTGILLLAPHLSRENAAELLSAAYGKTKSEIEAMLAQRFPHTAGLPMIVARTASRSTIATQLAPERVGRNDSETSLRAAPNVTPIAPDQYDVHFTISAEARDNLQYALALLGHAIPSG